MRKRIAASRLQSTIIVPRLLLLALVIGLTQVTAVAWAQTRISAAAIESTADIQHILEEGLQLERAKRWGEALTHYEEALQAFPDRTEIQTRARLTVARNSRVLALCWREMAIA